ncbi:MAG: DEAD/DEAH box helicase [Armatimonadetes bacterium]|nr:DEAD/DEAH box helicase [Armatimonadota bacterium]
MSQRTNSGFAPLCVTPDLCQSLKRHGIVEPTPIQGKAIPVAMSGADLVGIAQTGTGKTLAFGLPMVQLLKPGQVGLVLAPTRELAQQIAETFHKLHVPCVLVIGGASMGKQVQQLRREHRVIVATPGRLQDHLNQKTVRLDRVSIVVLDEADRMLDMGFAPAIKKILDTVPKRRQTLMFSATMPKEIADLADAYLYRPVRIDVAPAGTPSELVRQELFYVQHEGKQPLLHSLLDENRGSVLVFARTRHGARKLAKSIRNQGHSAAEIHSDRTLAQRREALQGFKDGEYRILVATDIAARGIDVKDIGLVINFDVPEKADDYVHRIGRTGRAGSRGKAITIALPDQSKDVRDIERLTGKELEVSPRSTAAPHAARTGRTRGKVAEPLTANLAGPAAERASRLIFQSAVSGGQGEHHSHPHSAVRPTHAGPRPQGSRFSRKRKR